MEHRARKLIRPGGNPVHASHLATIGVRTMTPTRPLRRPLKRNPWCLHAPAILVGLGLWSGAALAGVHLYVDKDGVGGAPDDSRLYGAAQNPATPVATIERGMALAQAGDTVLVRRATFSRSSPLGISKANFTLKAYPGELVTLDFAGETSGNGVNFGADGVTFEGFEITHSAEEGLSTWSTNNNTIRKCHIHD